MASDPLTPPDESSASSSGVEAEALETSTRLLLAFLIIFFNLLLLYHPHLPDFYYVPSLYKLSLRPSAISTYSHHGHSKTRLAAVPALPH